MHDSPKPSGWLDAKEPPPASSIPKQTGEPASLSVALTRLAQRLATINSQVAVSPNRADAVSSVAPGLQNLLNELNDKRKLRFIELLSEYGGRNEPFATLNSLIRESTRDPYPTFVETLKSRRTLLRILCPDRMAVLMSACKSVSQNAEGAIR